MVRGTSERTKITRLCMYVLFIHLALTSCWGMILCRLRINPHRRGGGAVSIEQKCSISVLLIKKHKLQRTTNNSKLQTSGTVLFYVNISHIPIIANIGINHSIFALLSHHDLLNVRH